MEKLSEEGFPLLRPDYMETKKRRDDGRSSDRLRAHYVLERQLAKRLLESSASERARVYTEVYSELFQSLPDHPQHTVETGNAAEEIADDLNFLRLSAQPNANFLEIGCGDARLSFAAAGLVHYVYGLDVTDELISFDRAPANFRFLKTKSTNIDLPDNSIDLVYSNQLMEHLHPDDAESQLWEVMRVLRPGASYWCRTPNRVTGPHDVSCYFDYTATGFHLREYDYTSIRALFKRAGFRKVRFVARLRGRTIPLPYWLARPAEFTVEHAPKLAHARIFNRLMGLNVIGTK
jgi:SAM-dependent methyltransferase